jgi:N-acetylglucosaminyl-diphospho-decaprenol L-rhamnosyltransferase
LNLISEKTLEMTSVVVVTYNSREVATECLSALAARIGSDFEVIVVDNNSSDGTQAMVRAAFPGITLIELPNNVGFAKGVQKGIKAARGDVFCLLNPDAVATPDTIDELAETLRRSANVGIIAPLIVNPRGRLRIVSAGHMPTTWRMFTHYSGLSRLAGTNRALQGHYLQSSQLRGTLKVDWVTGACLAIRKNTWDLAGGISDRWFMYAEDIELCSRVANLGYEVLLNSDLEATHLLGRSNTKADDGPIMSDWILNLYDFFITDLASKKSTGRAWRTVVAFGLWSRGVAFSARGRRTRSQAWTRESKKFFTYSSAVADIRGNKRY